MKQTITNLVDECKQFFKYICDYPRYRAMIRLLNDKDKRQELKSLAPSILQQSGESKFRLCFEQHGCCCGT